MHKPRGPNSLPPFRPIVSSIGTYNYELAKYLCSLLQPYIPTNYCTQDSFTFIIIIMFLTRFPAFHPLLPEPSSGPGALQGKKLLQRQYFPQYVGSSKHCDFLDFIAANVTWGSTSDLVLSLLNREFKIRRLRTTNYGLTSIVLCLQHWVESCKYRTLRLHYGQQTTREEAERKATRKDVLVFITVHKNASQFRM